MSCDNLYNMFSIAIMIFGVWAVYDSIKRISARNKESDNV